MDKKTAVLCLTDHKYKSFKFGGPDKKVNRHDSYDMFTLARLATAFVRLYFFFARGRTQHGKTGQ